MHSLLNRLAAYLVTGVGVGGGVWALTGDRNPVLAGLLVLGALAGAAVLLWRARVRPAAKVPPGMDSATVRITPVGVVVAMDMVALVASGLAGFFVVDGLAMRVMGIPPLLTDPLVADVIAVMFLPADFVLAGFVTGTGGQHVNIGPSGVCLSGPFGTESALWQDVTHMDWRDEYVVVSRVGMPMPRRLRTNLDIHLSEGGRLTIYEPATPGIRAALDSALKAHAPPRLMQRDPLAAS